MVTVKPSKGRKRGTPKRRVYVRFTEQDFAGIQILGVETARCVADVVHDATMLYVHNHAALNYKFRCAWVEESFRISREEHAL